MRILVQFGSKLRSQKVPRVTSASYAKPTLEPSARPNRLKNDFLTWRDTFNPAGRDPRVLFTLRASRRGRLEARACRGEAINFLSQYPYNCQQVTHDAGRTSLANNKPKVGSGPSKTCLGAFQRLQNQGQTLPRSSPEAPNSSPVASKTPFLGDTWFKRAQKEHRP